MKKDISKPLVSIITIVYNGVSQIERTILSVVNQVDVDFEFIIIDGNSNDGTQAIIDNYKNRINYFISEKDKGIYDAMNKGIRAANGTWLNFMNAGDIFYSNSVLKQVFKLKSEYNKIALIYGYKYEDHKLIKPFPLETLKAGVIMGNHQSMFFNSELLGNDLTYSLNYPIYSDYELVNRIFLKYGYKCFYYINLPIAIFEGGGLSSMVSKQKRIDKYSILLRHYGATSLIRAFVYSIGSKFKIKRRINS